MDKTKFGSYIREKRIENNLTQKELSDRLMIDVSAVSKWERGVTYPDITMIPDICKYLGISERELIESSNDSEYRKIKSDAKHYRRIKDSLFYSFLIGYLVAVLTCFVVNIAVNHTLSWFFIVFAACLCGFSFVPTFTRFFEKFKLGIFLLTSFSCLVILFLTCSIYTSDYWFGIASIGTLLLYFAVFYPIVFSRQEIYIGEKRYSEIKRFLFITYSLGLLLLTLLLLVVIRLYSPFSLGNAVKITLYCFLLPLIYGCVAILPLCRTAKAGIDCIFSGIHLYGLNGVLNLILSDTGIDYYHIDFYDWNTYSNGNVAIIGLSALLLAGMILIIIAVSKKRK